MFNQPLCRSKTSGLTLLETMLILALLTLGLVIGITQYKEVTFKGRVAQIKNSVQLLTTALEQYYISNCYWFLTDTNSYSMPYTISLNTNPTFLPVTTSPNPPNPTLQSYITQPNLIDNVYNSKQHGLNAYTYTIDVRGDFPIIRVSTTFNVSSSMQNILAGLLKPTSRQGNQFTWSTAPGNTYLTAAHLSPNLSYSQWLGLHYNVDRSSNTEQVAYQYVTDNTGQINVCTYWQQPQMRCWITKNSSRCDYQNKP